MVLALEATLALETKNPKNPRLTLTLEARLALKAHLVLQTTLETTLALETKNPCLALETTLVL